MESIVEKFKDYRKGKWQFAVLFAFPTKDVFEWLELVVKACSKPLNRDANPFYNYKHFIAATPANGKHSEKIILDKLSGWVKSSDENILQESKAIVLYSWIRPCPKCLKEIRRKLSPYTNTRKIMVLYTLTQKYDNKTKISYIKGIEINQAKYPYKLSPPAQQ